MEKIKRKNKTDNWDSEDCLSFSNIENRFFGTEPRQRGLWSSACIFLLDLVFRVIIMVTPSSFSLLITLSVGLIELILATYSVYNCVAFLKSATKSRGWPIVALIFSSLMIILFFFGVLISVINDIS
jgi:heme/copper-type cytochrome/quinol oxidase subunit 4